MATLLVFCQAGTYYGSRESGVVDWKAVSVSLGFAMMAAIFAFKSFQYILTRLKK